MSDNETTSEPVSQELAVKLVNRVDELEAKNAELRGAEKLETPAEQKLRHGQEMLAGLTSGGGQRRI
jgi:hypothetical protein